MVVICCYPERKNGKVCKFHLNNSLYFKISTSLQQASHLEDSKLNKSLGYILKEIW